MCFHSDSIKGFDEEAAKQMAISEGFVGDEFLIKLYQLKRDFVNKKYKLISKTRPPANINQNISALQPALLNDDFEQSAAATITTTNQVLGWDCFENFCLEQSFQIN